MGSLIWVLLVTEKHEGLIEGVSDLQCGSCLPAYAQPGMMVYHLVLCLVAVEILEDQQSKRKETCTVFSADNQIVPVFISKTLDTKHWPYKIDIFSL